MTSSEHDEPSARRFAIGLTAILLVASALRLVFPTADPPWHAPVGIVWHDEGAWTHNARNKALFGEWRTDEWNPLYIAPVFTLLEYISFRAFGVGLAQARLVSEFMGLLSVLLIGLAVARIAGRRAGLCGAGLLATNYVYVMWNRAALLETTMVVFIVVTFYFYVRAMREPAWGIAAGIGAWLAFFSKAAAAFLLPALALAAAWPLVRRWWNPGARHSTPDLEWRAGVYTLAGLVVGALLALIFFVGPNWQEYWFYNWQVSVTRKPSYTFKALLDRLSWFPVIHDFFTRMWLVLVVSVVALLPRAARWFRLPGAERLLVAWLVIGVVELLVHDVGNERRLIFLVPAMSALAAIVLARDGRLLPSDVASAGPVTRLVFAPVVFYAAYVVLGAMGRMAFLHEIRPSVRISALLAVVAGVALYGAWSRFLRVVASAAIVPRAAMLLVGIVMCGDVVQFVQWAVGRTDLNYQAMRLVGERIPVGTLVHGKLANGLSLESGIKPVFVGRGFGNYADRLTRDDIRYLLTYVSPRVGYEGDIIEEVVDAYPQARIVWTVPVAETSCGCDRAALFDKHPESGHGQTAHAAARR